MKIRNPLLFTPNAKQRIDARQLFAPLAALAALLGFTALPGLPYVALTAATTVQLAPPSLYTWSSQGPWGGYIGNLAIAPSNPNILYAFTEDDVFKSTDRGVSWKHAGRTGNFARVVAIDTFDPEVLYFKNNVVTGTAFKSIDGGASWNAIGPPDTPVNALAMASTDPATLYTLDDKFRLSKSTDGGATWKRTGTGLPKHTGRGHVVYVGLVVSPDDSQTLYAAVGSVIAENHQGLYRSTDGGVSWVQVGVGPFHEASIFKLVIAPSNPNVLYAGIYGGVFRSTDGGATWVAIGETSSERDLLAVDPGDAAVVYAKTTDGRVLRSTDGGASWSEAKVGLYGAPTLALVIDPRDTTNLYAATGSGVFTSDDGGVSWQEASSGLGAGINFLATPAAGALLADAGWSGLFLSTDSGGSWERAALPGPAYLFAVDPNHANLTYAVASARDFLYKSTNGGASWSATPVDLPGTHLYPLTIDPSNPEILYAGLYEASTNKFAISRSTDGGASWARLSKGLDNAYQLVLDPYNPNTLYALAYVSCVIGGELDFCSAVVKSTDGGASWSQSTEAFTQTWASALVLDRDNPGTLYVALGDGGMTKTTDGGKTWRATGLLPDPDSDRYNNLVIDPTDPETLYAGHGNGVFRSTDGGASWGELTPALPADLEIRSLAMDPAGTSLHAGTQRGVFSYHLPVPCAAPLSLDNQSFEAGGGASLVEVAAASDCSWTVESSADWLRLTSTASSKGSATVSYTVAPNVSTSPRTGRLSIGGRILKVTQAGLPVSINSATVSGKRLIVRGEGFDSGAVILINDEAQVTKNDPQNPNASLISKKAGKKIKAGDRLRVRNPNGSLSEEIPFSGS